MTARVTLTLGGQQVATTGSLPFSFNDTPCPLPPPIVPPPVGSGAGISVFIDGPTDLDRNSLYTYTTRVINNATGLEIPLFSNGSISPLPIGQRAGKGELSWTMINNQVGRPVGQLSPGTTLADINNAAFQTDNFDRSTGRITVSVSVNIGGVIVFGGASKPVSINDPGLSTILGDIFGRGNVDRIQVGEKAVVSSTGNITVSRSSGIGRTPNVQSRDIVGYTPSAKLDWNRDVSQPTTSPTGQLQRLIDERAIKLDGNATSVFTIQPGTTFNLNPVQQTKDGWRSSALNTANPGGTIWYVPGDLRISSSAQAPVKFRGLGTIVVRGKVIVDGPVGYENPIKDLVGIISLHQNADAPGVEFVGSSSNAVVGTYFAPGSPIKFESGVSTALGLFVGNKIFINGALSGLQISFDGRITTTPPPGFRQSVLPILTELTP